MNENNELQNEEMYLPGDLGKVTVSGVQREITSVFQGKDGSVTLTIGKTVTPLMIDGHKISGLGILWPEKTITKP